MENLVNNCNYLYFFKNAEEERVIHSKSKNIKFTRYDNANEVVVELFQSLFSRYQGTLKRSMRGSNFIFESVQMVKCKCRGGSYIDSLDWTKKKKKNNKSKK